ncbi:MAG: hypothetical protein C0412_18650 [Flavobacterium sp.]|nr:hypothetical protein [Flavobacterium sp.]
MLKKAPRNYRELCNQFERVLLGEESEFWEREAKKFLSKHPCWNQKENSYLKLISDGKKVILASTDGKETITNAQKIFPSGIDSDFKNWNLDVPSASTEETKIQVFEIIKDGTFKDIFGSFGENLDRLCLSQAQIISFVKDHSKWLRKDGYKTFFLFKMSGEYFVARVDLRFAGLNVYVHRFSYDNVWPAENRPRIVVPQL